MKDLKEKLINEMNEKIAKANKETDEQKNIVKFFKGKCENQLMIIEQQKNEIMTLKDEVKHIENAKVTNRIGKGMWRTLIKIIGMSYAKGDSIDTILEKVEKILEK